MIHINPHTLNKFRLGDAITDTELDNLIEFFSEAVSVTEQLGPKYALFRDDCRRQLDRLQSYKQSRNER